MLPHHLPPANCSQIVVALSGGVDSMALLHWAQQLTAEFGLALKALHINHQLSPNAGDWQRQVEQYCQRANIPLHVVKVDVNNLGQGIEAAARQARYIAFEQNLLPNDVLVVGHHQQDQAETFLLRLLRGAGINGLSAMDVMRPLGKSRLWRPLLSCSKTTILEYAQQHGLTWVEDESNLDDRFRRNYLRNNILPALESIWPSATQKIAEAASHASEAQQLLAEYGLADFQTLNDRPEKLGFSISLAPLKALSWVRQKHALRCWLTSHELSPPSAVQLDELKKLIAAGEDAQPELVLGDNILRRYSGRLFLLPKLPSANKELVIAFNGQCQLPDGSLVTVSGYSGELSIRFRQGGERAQPHCRQYSQTLKKLLQEYAVAPWLRDRIPLIYCGETLIAVADYWLEVAAVSTCQLKSPNELIVQWVFPSCDSTPKKVAK